MNEEASILIAVVNMANTQQSAGFQFEFGTSTDKLTWSKTQGNKGNEHGAILLMFLTLYRKR